MAKTLAVVQAKKDNAFTQIQCIYDFSKKISDKDICQKLLIRAKSLRQIRQDFAESLDLFNELQLEADSTFKPNYAPLNSADEMIDYINATVHSIEQRKISVQKKSEQVQSEPQQTVRLPKFELKIFRGDAMDWISFINLFDSSIHANTALTDVVKFQYLLGSVVGEPLNLIKSLPITGANYKVAYDLLKERYHSPRRLITMHLNHVLDLPTVSHSSTHMRKFVNSYNENIQALKALEIDITANNPLLCAMIMRKMDNTIRKKFEHSLSLDKTNNSVLSDPMKIVSFLNQECSEIENSNLHSTSMTKNSSSISVSASENKYFKPNKTFVGHKSGNVSLMTYNNNESNSENKIAACFVCEKDHKIYSCPVFKNHSSRKRFELVKKHNRCIACLGNHQLNQCKSKASCFTCQKRTHHTLLHFDTSQSSQLPTSVELNVSGQQPQVSMTTTEQSSSRSTVLLGTLLVKLTSSQGISYVFRALADSGSQSCFLTEQAAQILCAPRSKSNHSVVGLSQVPTRSKGLTSLSIETVGGKLISPNHEFLIIDKICADLPRMEIDPVVFERVRPYILADPTFHLPGGIDVLLGGSVFPLILNQLVHNLGSGLPSLIGTHFGFLVMGDTPCKHKADTPTTSHLSTTLLVINNLDLHKSLQQFWQQEEPPVSNKKSKEEELCDEHFTATFSREQSGRFCVRLPFKPDHPPLGQSKDMAEKRLHQLERKFKAQPQFQALYSDFMTEYISLGHMEKVNTTDLTTPHYFLPHHGVLKESSSTTRLRTVFDASAKTSNGTSLNDILLTGKKMQNNICDLLLIFRIHKIVFSCDIRQMYRQIKIHPDDQKYQLILWHLNSTHPTSIYKLTTVTYGMSCSPYLAIKTLHQLAIEDGDFFPEAAELLRSQTFVDDVIAGADTEEEALRLQKQLISLLKCGQFELRKWISNSTLLLSDLPNEHLETPVFLQDNQPHFTILGIHWSASNDCFTYTLNFPNNATTKRQVLSVIAQIYDPCGFLSPVTMWAKRFMQLLWTKCLEWDQPLSPELLAMWQNFVDLSGKLQEISIPRALHSSCLTGIELHGFADASENGYAAAIYLRTPNPNGYAAIQLLFSKTRVAPLKKLTVPRLELCAAHLLAQSAAYLLSIFHGKLELSCITLWCDSTVALTWLQTPPHRLKTFVANRVAQVQELVPLDSWRHIASEDNPADCASRGILPFELPDHELWWSGPSWLKESHQLWPVSKFTPTPLSDTGESKPLSPVTLIVTDPQEWDLLSKFSHFNKLQRVMAYILRYIFNLRHSQKRSASLTTNELTTAKLTIFKLLQSSAFKDDLETLKNNKDKPLSMALHRLSPIIDKEGILRVGGRLNNYHSSEDVRHPVILPKRHHVVNLLIDFYHLKYLHSGTQLTQSLLAQQVWILSARSTIRSRIFKCITCFHHKPRNETPIMGDLPQVRVTPARPFLNTGVDYGGPFNIKVHHLRTTRLTKAYICAFICLVTKAIHIEVVTDLSAESFIAALKRFVSRRGLCHNLYSDCGTNFVGANNILQTLMKSEKARIVEFTTQHEIKFHFNPPAAPHQGGLWEAAIKSIKHHLRHVVGDHILTLVQFMTLTTQIEAILNSRPLTPLSNDSSDFTALTPGHFLIGSPLVAVPEESHLTTLNRLKHWKLIEAFHQRLWKRWQLEYLHTLHQRLKWTKATTNLQIGDLVLIHQPTPPLTWPLARVIDVSPGKDGVVRVVHLRTQHGRLTRPAHKVFPLPISH